MNLVFQHLFESSLLLIAGALLYRFLLRNTGSFQLNRVVLLGFVILAPLLPLIDIPLNPSEGSTAQIFLDAVTIGGDYAVQESATESGANSTSSLIGAGLLGAYLTGVLIFSLLLLRDLRTIRRIISTGTKVKDPLAGDIVLHQNTATFSFFNTLVLNERGLDRPSERARVIAHELAHIQQRHTADVLIAEIAKILFWFNPASWMLKSSVQENCEFLADEAVVGRQQEDSLGMAREYARLLLDQSIASLRADAVRTPFHQSRIKRRISMLLRSTNGRSAAWKYAVALMLIGPMVMAVSCAYSEAAPEAVVTSQQDLKLVDMAELDSQPEFEGGMTELFAWMGQNIKYPASARKDGKEGKTMVRFVVDPTGSVTNAEVVKGFHDECDAEALRAVGSMPDWKPAMKDGEAVAVQLTLPIAFKLPPPAPVEEGQVPPPPPHDGNSH